MIEVRDAAGRFPTREEGRTTWHSFSFGAHYDPANTGFGTLLAHNDEHLPAGSGYADHPHADLEIVTWVVSGGLRHRSTVGSAVLGPGQVQRLSAGSGVVHSETQHDAAPTRFVQAWVRPDEPGLVPGYMAQDPGSAGSPDAWTCLASGGGDGVVPLAARGTTLHVADLGPGARLDLPDAPLLHVFVSAGEVLLGERRLVDGDAARLHDEGGRRVSAEAGGQVLVWAFTR